MNPIRGWHQRVLAWPIRDTSGYLPDNNSVVVDLRDARGKLRSEWFDPATGQYAKPGRVRGGNKVTFTSPFGASDAVLYLRKRR